MPLANNLEETAVLNWTWHHYKCTHMNKTLEFGTQIPILSNDTKLLKILQAVSHQCQP